MVCRFVTVRATRPLAAKVTSSSGEICSRRTEEGERDSEEKGDTH